MSDPGPARPGRRSPKKLQPAALHAGVMEALSPLDPLRLRFVAHDPEVRAALEIVEARRQELAAARALAKSSHENARAHERAVRAHADLVRLVLEPAVRDAERRRALLAAAPPDALAR